MKFVSIKDLVQEGIIEVMECVDHFTIKFHIKSDRMYKLNRVMSFNYNELDDPYSLLIRLWGIQVSNKFQWCLSPTIETRAERYISWFIPFTNIRKWSIDFTPKSTISICNFLRINKKYFNREVLENDDRKFIQVIRRGD